MQTGINWHADKVNTYEGYSLYATQYPRPPGVLKNVLRDSASWFLLAPLASPENSAGEPQAPSNWRLHTFRPDGACCISTVTAPPAKEFSL